jgi:uncharacterized protein
MLERRFISTALRAITPTEISSNSPGTLEGYSALWSHPGKKQNFSGDLGGFVERLAMGSLEAPKSGDVYALWNHNSSTPLARTGNGTLQLRSDNTGLHSTIQLPDTSFARDLHASVSRRDVAGQSFGFQCLEDSWDECDPSEIDPNDYDGRSSGKRIRVRTVRRAKLLEISPCTLPAYGGTGISVSGTIPSIMGRSFDALFPDGIPNEIRARIPDARQRFEQSTDRATRVRNMTNLILSL